MTTVTISLKTNDLREYNLAMSAIDPTIKEVAAQFNGSAEMGPMVAPGKPSIRAEFNTEADADDFIKEVRAGEKILAQHQFPAFKITKS